MVRTGSESGPNLLVRRSNLARKMSKPKALRTGSHWLTLFTLSKVAYLSCVRVEEQVQTTQSGPNWLAGSFLDLREPVQTSVAQPSRTVEERTLPRREGSSGNLPDKSFPLAHVSYFNYLVDRWTREGQNPNWDKKKVNVDQACERHKHHEPTIKTLCARMQA